MALLFEIGRWIFKNMIPKHKVVVAVCRFTEDVDVHSVDVHNPRCSLKIGLDALHVCVSGLISWPRPEDTGRINGFGQASGRRRREIVTGLKNMLWSIYLGREVKYQCAVVTNILRIKAGLSHIYVTSEGLASSDSRIWMKRKTLSMS